MNIFKVLILLDVLFFISVINGCQAPEGNGSSLASENSKTESEMEGEQVFPLQTDEIKKIEIRDYGKGTYFVANQDDKDEIISKLNDFRCSYQEDDPFYEIIGGGFGMCFYRNSHPPFDAFILEFGNSWVSCNGIRYNSVESDYFSDEWLQKWEDRLPPPE